jgi:hypothetical protein
MLAHEIMHKYDHFKKPERYLGHNATYNAVQSIGIKGVDPINKFTHLLYYVHQTEEITRSSQFYSLLKNNHITKEKFKQFFNESDMIEKLRECRDYTLAKLVSELHEYIEPINDFLEEVKDRVGEPIDLNGTDIYKINLVLKFTFMMLINAKLEIFHNILKSSINPFALMFGKEPFEADMMEKQKFMDDFIKQARKYKNYKDFFGNEIKMLNFAGDKTIKKLSKLYDMVDSDKNSLVNWELHHKINKTAEKTKERLHELLSNTTPEIYKKKD